MGAAAVQPVAAQGPAEPVSVDVSECVKLTTPEERLACFERQVESAETTGQGAAAPSSSSAPASDASTGRGRDTETESTTREFQGRVVELRETVPNTYVITLDNGQVWRQTVPKVYPLQPGYPVRIYFSRWRSYRLTNETLKGFIQVERVR
jgi:hypothetical protein